MIVIKDKRDCSGCYACKNVCPVNCIHMETDEEGFWYPKVDFERCIECCACIISCHVINKYVPDNHPVAYAAKNKDEAIRAVSSSGGVFTALAEAVLDDGGVVFGVEYDDNFNVKHSYVEKKEDLDRYRGSKYVQSEVKDAHHALRTFLDAGRPVLFTATPCQIAGVYNYLSHFREEPYDHLFTMENICHGVPSPKMWAKYVAYTRTKKAAEIAKVDFRDKTKGWRDFSVKFDFKNGKNQLLTMDDDPYLFGFLRNIYLRPACHRCTEKSLHRKSDITVADFWGVEHMHPDFSDDKGVSLIYVNSPQGEKLFERIRPQLKVIDSDVKQSAKYNIAATHNTKPNKRRDEFFRDFDNMPFEQLLSEYCQPSAEEKKQKKRQTKIDKVKNVIKKVIRWEKIRTKIRR